MLVCYIFPPNPRLCICVYKQSSTCNYLDLFSKFSFKIVNFTPKILFHLPNFPLNSSSRIFFLEFLGISFPSFPRLKLQQLLILLPLLQLRTVLVSQLLIVKNYQTWSRSMILALTAKTKIGFVNGTIYQ